MNRTKLKTYAPQARCDFIAAVTERAALYGLTAKQIEPVTEQGDVAIIGGKAFPRTITTKRTRLEERITRQGFEQVMEAMAYTWFNRLVAIRFMELHGYLDHGYRVLSHPEGKTIPEIVEHAEHVDLPGLNKDRVIDLKLDGTKEAELYRLLLIAQCNALSTAMPFLFERIDDETELLLPDNLLHSDSLIRKLVNEIDEEDWQEVEIIGWLYQFYISEKKDQVIGKVVKSEDIPAATQLFTPNWIVKYLVQNTLGRQWLATYPDSSLREKMEYYIEPAEQTPEVQAQLKAITPGSLNPEELTLLDPACGSGHILVEAYDLLKDIYLERGYRIRDIPTLILQKNLFGLEIDDRAAQLAAFALMMKARADDRRVFGREVEPQVLSIQESKGLDAKQLTDAINAPVVLSKRLDSDEFEFMEDVNTPLFSKKNLAVKGEIEESDIAALVQLFENAKTFGSLITVPQDLVEQLPAIAKRVEEVRTYGDLETQAAARTLRPLIEQAQVLAYQFDDVVTNPPYMGSKYFQTPLKNFVTGQYSEGKGDLYSCFVQRNLALTCKDGAVAMITIPNWMFLSTFESFRESLLRRTTIVSFIHNGRGVWGADFGSCAFVVQNTSLPKYRGIYRKLFEKNSHVASNEELKSRFFDSSNFVVAEREFQKIPGSPLAYWASSPVRDAFAANPPISSLADARQGLATADNNRFLRFWYEVELSRISFDCSSRDVAIDCGAKWFPYNKGGEFRRWFGNYEYVLDWENGGVALTASDKAVVRNPNYYFREGVTWSDVTISDISFRYLPSGFICDSTGHTAYFRDKSDALTALCMMNTNFLNYLTKIINPTVHFHIGYFNKLPFIHPKASLFEIAEEAIQISRTDWMSHETSWEFQTLEILTCKIEELIEQSFARFSQQCVARRRRLRELEVETNRAFLEAFGVEAEFSPGVPESQITLWLCDRKEDIQCLLSYALGCMMGRYSLDKPGLIYAHSGNKDFDHEIHKIYEKKKAECLSNDSYFSSDSCISWFAPDQDGIIPLTDTEWFPDDATNRLVEFISVAWPKEHLEENLKFVADSLGPNRNEQPRETIRRYFATGFFKDHLKTYKRRPIYWLFSSGKQRAFQCLVYLHRYNEGTLSRMRTEYVIPLQGKIASRIEHLAGEIAAAASTSHRRKQEKERDKLIKQQAELQTFDEKLRHYADQRISLDLDDGVKVNYGKFGDLLAEVKAVTGKKEE